MSSAVVVDSSGQATPLHSPTIERKQLETPKRKKIKEDYGKYEVGVLLFTQFSYIPVACTLLSTAFYQPSKEYCQQVRNSNGTDIYKYMGPSEFHSVLLDWNLACQDSIVIPVVSTALMFGALVGSIVAGWLADTYGRKPVIRGSLLAICIGNVIFSLVANIWWPLAAMVLFALGAACGGFMVTNLVLLIECLESPQSRLLAVSLNGWSVSMVATAAFARIFHHWLSFHLMTAASALLFAIIGHLTTVESCRWLATVHRVSEARSSAEVIARKNGFPVSPDATWYEILGFSTPPSATQGVPEQKYIQQTRKEYGYKDLYRTSSVFYPLCALCYCFTASSLVSFGVYFIADSLPGDRYMNMAIMGMGKFLLGLIPFMLSPLNIGRRPIVLWSVGVSAVAALAICSSQLGGVSPSHWSLSVLSLLIAATIDPTWKINHLYSTELFPTAIRNRARGVCNGGSRLGSVVTPFMVHLRSVHYLIPYVIFAILLSVQWLVVLGYLPETQNKPLPDDFKSNETDEQSTLNESIGSKTHFTDDDEILRIEMDTVDSEESRLEV